MASLKHGVIWAGVPALERFGNRGLPWKIALVIARALQRLRPEYASLDVARRALVDEHGQRKPDGALEVSPTGFVVMRDQQAFDVAWRELLQDTVDVGPVVGIGLDQLPVAVELPASDLAALLELGVLTPPPEPEPAS
jgi:hypothetical protein